MKEQQIENAMSFHFKSLYYDQFILYGTIFSALFLIIMGFIDTPISITSSEIFNGFIFSIIILVFEALIWRIMFFQYKKIYFQYYIYEDKMKAVDSFLPFRESEDFIVLFEDVKKIRTRREFFKKLNTIEVTFILKDSSKLELSIPTKIRDDLMIAYKSYKGRSKDSGDS